MLFLLTCWRIGTPETLCAAVLGAPGAAHRDLILISVLEVTEGFSTLDSRQLRGGCPILAAREGLPERGCQEGAQSPVAFPSVLKHFLLEARGKFMQLTRLRSIESYKSQAAAPRVT